MLCPYDVATLLLRSIVAEHEGHVSEAHLAGADVGARALGTRHAVVRGGRARLVAFIYAGQGREKAEPVGAGDPPA